METLTLLLIWKNGYKLQCLSKMQPVKYKKTALISVFFSEVEPKTYMKYHQYYESNLYIYIKKTAKYSQHEHEWKFREYPGYFNPLRAASVKLDKFSSSSLRLEWHTGTYGFLILICLSSKYERNMSSKNKHMGDSSRIIWWSATMKFWFICSFGCCGASPVNRVCFVFIASCC